MVLLFSLAGASAVEVSAGYFGHLVTHPGGFVGVELPLLDQGQHGVWLGGRVATYTHPGNHVGVLLRPELGYRLTATAGPFLEVAAGPAYHHRILSGAVYNEADGEVGRRLDAGRPGFAPGGGLGLGWNLSGAVPLRITGRAEGWMTTPINRGWRAGAAVSLGVTWLGAR